MKMVYTSANGRLAFELEVTTGKQAFEVVAAIQELFEESMCGCCKSTHIHCEVREPKGFKYFSLKCLDCGAKMDFGQSQDGKSLFAKRTDKDTRERLPNNGW